jgi:beta-lactamase regulating signal transducer with metallopeptidase domain
VIAALLDHLWQSTLFLGGVALLALALQHNPARLRYRLWLLASLKFLLPFSILAWLGAALAPPVPPRLLPMAELRFVTTGASPFAAALPQTPPVASFNPLLLLFAFWLTGFVLVLLIWFGRWCRLKAALRDSGPLALSAPIPVRVTAAPLGPGLFGIFRPILLLPEGITARLSARELRAILDHELCHLERNDNLTAALHGIVEALFWFHPAIWWLGARLIAERERACDECVVESNEPGIYAEGILTVCRFYAIPPLAASVLSADLDERLHGIMAQRPRRELNFPQKALIGICAVLAIAWPLLTGWSNAAAGEIARAAVKDAAQAALDRQIAQLQTGEPGGFERISDAGLRHEDTTSRAACESHFIAVLQALETSYGRFAPLYPERAKNSEDRLPMSLTWKNGRGASQYQEATVYMKAETAHIWDARRRLDGRTIDAAAAWSADSESSESLCLTEIDVRA